MADDYGPTYITVVSEDGEEYQLEHIDTILLDKQEYMAFLPADMDEDDENFGYVFLKLVEENGEEFFCNIEDDILGCCAAFDETSGHVRYHAVEFSG